MVLGRGTYKRESQPMDIPPPLSPHLAYVVNKFQKFLRHTEVPAPENRHGDGERTQRRLHSPHGKNHQEEKFPQHQQLLSCFSFSAELRYDHTKQCTYTHVTSAVRSVSLTSCAG